MNRVIQCGIENFVFVVAVTKQKAVLSEDILSATGNCERERERQRDKNIEKTLFKLFKPFTEGLEVDAKSLNPDAGASPHKSPCHNE